MVVFVDNKIRKNLFIRLFFERFVIGHWLIMRFFLDFLSFLRSVSQNLIAKIDRTFTLGMINEERRNVMKDKFKLWLISLNCDLINDLGIDEIVSRVDDRLEIVIANKEERAVLEDLIKCFNS